MKKRKQHYVSKFYLKAWCENDRFYCLRAGQIFVAHVNDIAQQRDFYRLRELTAADIELVKRLAIDPSPEHLRPFHSRLLNEFARIPALRGIVDAHPDASEEERQFLDEAVNNLEEELHSGAEGRGAPLIAAMLQGDTSFYQDSRLCADFLHFLALQNMRTKRVREVHAERATSAKLPIDTSRVWNVLTHIFATNVGWSLFLDRRSYRLVLLDNPHPIPMITGDQPILNILGPEDGSPPDELAFYYPLSPTRAMVLTDKPDLFPDARTTLTLEEVDRFNRRIARTSLEQVYSNSREYLAQLREAV